MSINFDIINIKVENLNESEKVLLIAFIFEHKEKNLTWKLEKAYDVIIYYFNDLINKVPNFIRPPLLIECNNKIELYSQKLKEYIDNLLKRKEVYNLFSFQKFFEYPDELLEKQITIDTLSNITENNIFDFYFYEPYLFISCGNSNSSKALSFLFTYFEAKGLYLTYKINNSPGSYGEKKLTEISKKGDEQYVTKFKKIKDFLFLGYNNGNIGIIDFNNEKKEPNIYTKIENVESSISLNGNYKISNIFYKAEKGLIYIFIENEKKVSIYEINHKNHIKDIKLTEYPIIYSYISFEMKKIFVIDSYGTFWIYELLCDSNTVKLLQASYTKLYNISTAQIFNQKNNDQTLNIFVGESDKVHIYQYSNKNNNFILKLICEIKFKINYIIYIKKYKCLMIGCNNGTIQIWKDSSKIPEFIIESGYSNIDKLFYDEINNYIFINNNKNLKIIEIDLEKILINVNEEEKNSKNMIAETLKDEDDKVAENNMILLSKAFQTPKSSSNKNEKNINDKSGEEVENKKEINNKENRDTEDESNIDENEYNYEVRNIDGLDGWNEW
jgi:hypothetical protein